jgi:hypothetical protein
VHCVKTFSLRFGQLGHASGNNAQPGTLKTGVNLADYVFGNGIGFDDGKRAFDSHKNPLLPEFEITRKDSTITS